MANVYINPQAASNGVGSVLDPMNVWPDAATFVAGNKYLQIEGSTWFGHNGNALYNILVSASGAAGVPITLGTYEAQTGNHITDGSRRARIDGTGRSMAVRVTQRSWVDVIGLDLWCTGTDTQVARAAYFGNSASQPASNCRLINCRIVGIPDSGNGDDNAIQVFGNNCVVRGCIIDDIADDGIWLQGNDNIIEHNSISRVGQSSATTGDGIQVFGDATLGVSRNIIRHNDIEHSDREEKQCIIVQGLSATSQGALVYGNRLIHFRGGSASIIALYIELQDVIAFGNLVEGGYYGILTGKTVNGDGDRAKIFGNVVIGSKYGIDQGSTCVGGKIIGNTIVDTTVYGIYADNDTTIDVRNNIICGGAAGIGLEAGATEDYNCIYGISGNAITSLGGGARTLGANSITSDPLLTSDYRLSELSPCRGAGIFIPGAKHMGGQSMNPGTPDIGAYRYREPARPVLFRAVA